MFAKKILQYLRCLWKVYRDITGNDIDIRPSYRSALMPHVPLERTEQNGNDTDTHFAEFKNFGLNVCPVFPPKNISQLNFNNTEILLMHLVIWNVIKIIISYIIYVEYQRLARDLKLNL